MDKDSVFYQAYLLFSPDAEISCADNGFTNGKTDEKGHLYIYLSREIADQLTEWDNDSDGDEGLDLVKLSYDEKTDSYVYRDIYGDGSIHIWKGIDIEVYELPLWEESEKKIVHVYPLFFGIWEWTEVPRAWLPHGVMCPYCGAVLEEEKDRCEECHRKLSPEPGLSDPEDEDCDDDYAFLDNMSR